MKKETNSFRLLRSVQFVVIVAGLGNWSKVYLHRHRRRYSKWKAEFVVVQLNHPSFNSVSIRFLQSFSKPPLVNRSLGGFNATVCIIKPVQKWRPGSYQCLSMSAVAVLCCALYLHITITYLHKLSVFQSASQGSFRWGPCPVHIRPSIQFGYPPPRHHRRRRSPTFSTISI